MYWGHLTIDLWAIYRQKHREEYWTRKTKKSPVKRSSEKIGDSKLQKIDKMKFLEIHRMWRIWEFSGSFGWSAISILVLGHFRDLNTPWNRIHEFNGCNGLNVRSCSLVSERISICCEQVIFTSLSPCSVHRNHVMSDDVETCIRCGMESKSNWFGCCVRWLSSARSLSFHSLFASSKWNVVFSPLLWNG